MKQYFVTYTLNGGSILQKFSCPIAVESKETAEKSFWEVLAQVAFSHNETYDTFVTKEDIGIEVLTRLN